ncbi:MAG TPA: hypothetical protein VHM31_00970 [Polyangia bacterium]|nr:hypothetical protein [Polyangia bacterium]
MPKIRLAAFGLVFVAGGGSAVAQVSQPTGESMPQPANPAELACCVTGRGFPADADTLNGLFMYRGDVGMDQTRDAHMTPGTFSPQCGLSGTIVLHGGDCKNPLGWYNATTNPPTVPTAIYPMVPGNLQAAPPNGISCIENGFCPLATRMSTQPGQHTWADPLPDFAANIRTDPHWTGGPVGFALVGVAGSKCTQTKYSQAELNDHSPAGGTTNGKPWVSALIYQSTSNPNGYYIAFEDQPTCTASWHGCDGANPKSAANGNDGDFNDFVFYVTGIDCAGGGKDCDTGLKGICQQGLTQCSNGGMSFVCKSINDKRTEVCNGLDDDCDGVVDNPEAPELCPAGQVCSQGTCVFPCNDSEFPCSPPSVCDKMDQLCKDPLCVGKSCKSGEVCYRGSCIGGCDGVVCPAGQTCRLGNCVDPCAGITCGDNQVCENGACLGPCGCRDCPAGKACSKKGTCVDTGCDKQTCAAGQVCVAGKCQDGCEGAICPTGQQCMKGACVTPAGGPVVPIPDGGATGGTVGSGGRSGSGTGGQVGATGGSNGLGGSGVAGGSGTGDASGARPGGIHSCSCDESGAPRAGGLAVLLAALAITARRRRGQPARR